MVTMLPGAWILFSAINHHHIIISELRQIVREIHPKSNAVVARLVTEDPIDYARDTVIVA